MVLLPFATNSEAAPERSAATEVLTADFADNADKKGELEREFWSEKRLVTVARPRSGGVPTTELTKSSIRRSPLLVRSRRGHFRFRIRVIRVTCRAVALA